MKMLFSAFSDHLGFSVKNQDRDFPGNPVLKNFSSNAGDVGPIPSQGTKIPQATTQHMYHNAWALLPQLHGPRALEPTYHNWREAHVPQRTIPHTTTKTQHPKIKEEMFFKN